MMYRGGCQCGAVAFEAEGEITEVMECNCSICRPKGYLHWFVPEASFRLTASPAGMGEYLFNKQQLHHRFCDTCGCSPFVTGPGSVAVNVRCVADVDISTLSVKQFDGAHKS